MASFKAGGLVVRGPRPDAAHDHLSLLSHQSPVLRDAGDGRLTWAGK